MKIDAVMMFKEQTETLERVFAKARKAVIISHYSPDGDAVGSVVACTEYLSNRGVDAVAVLPSPAPYNLKFLSAACGALVYEEEGEAVLSAIASADLIVCLDISNLSRTEYLEEAVRGSKAAKVLVDHHVSPDREPFDIVFSTVEVSSACELLYAILLEMSDVKGDSSHLTQLCRNALYTGMMTDTNNFANSVFPGTFSMASGLLEGGVDKDMLQDEVFKSCSADRMRLMGHMLYNKLHFVPEYNAAYMTLSESEKKEYNYVTGDSEGFVNLPLSIGAVRISALFTETSTGYVRVSLRSKRGTDVNVLARGWFNGGGHVNASGGRLMDIGLDAVGDYFAKSLKECYDK